MIFTNPEDSDKRGSTGSFGSNNESTKSSNSMKIKEILLALFAVFALCSCNNKEMYVGTWETESIEIEDGINMKYSFTFRENGKLIMRIKGKGKTHEEGTTVNMSFSVKATGTWSSSFGLLKIDLDKNNLVVDIDDMFTGEPLMDAMLEAILEDEESKQELIDEMKSEIDLDDLNGEVNVTSISDEMMIIENVEGGTITFYKKK